MASKLPSFKLGVDSLGEEKQVVFIHCHMPTTFNQLRSKWKSVACVLKRLLTINASFPPLMFTLKKSYETIKAAAPLRIWKLPNSSPLRGSANAKACAQINSDQSIFCTIRPQKSNLPAPGRCEYFLAGFHSGSSRSRPALPLKLAG